jgi:hypothetical protein
LTGRLVATSRGFALDVDDGGRWRLDVTDPNAATWLVGQRVTATGIRSGFDLLDVAALAIAD